MMDIQASLGIHQLARVDETHARRAEVWARYAEAFAELPLRLPVEHRQRLQAEVIEKGVGRSPGDRTTRRLAAADRANFFSIAYTSQVLFV